jgi:ATP-dependent protease ClpP protease subunit
MGSITKNYDDDESGVDNLMAEYFIKGMHILETTNDKEISIVMNNPGGDWYHGMAIFDSIKCSPCPTIVKVYGHAMSMGSVILQAADYRIMMPNARFMIHYGYDGRYGHSKIFERWSDEGKKVNHQMENIYLDSIMKRDDEQTPDVLEKVLTDITNRLKAFEYPSQEILSLKFNRKNRNLRREEVRKVLKELLNFDTIMTPQETVDLGLADLVFTP